jgi:ABC-2 type transport system ATP-binding protein
MRMMLGLDRPTAGEALIDGKPYRRLSRPLRHVGALLDGRAAHGGRGAAAHLHWLARTNGIPAARVAEVLSLVGLSEVANGRVKSFSLGMGQRLGLAVALLGDPPVLLLDEPVNGLDPEGIRWLRTLLRSLATEGRTVLVSSHLMSETAQTADHLVVIGRGRLLADTTLREFVAASTRACVRIRVPEPERMSEVLATAGIVVKRMTDGALEAGGVQAARVGELAVAHGLAVHEIREQESSLEDAFLRLTGRAAR